MNPVAIRLLNQQLCSPQFSTHEEVVAHLGAMQAQEYRLMRWAVSMRTKKPSSEAFRQAFDIGRIVRLHLMRGTWQLVTGDDYWWMLDLLAEKSRRVIRGWMTSNHIFIPDDEYVRIRKIIARCAEDCGSATKEDFVNALAAQDIKMDDHRLSYHIRMAELSGTLCSGKLLPMKATYSLAESRIPHREHLDREEALTRLTRKYFISRCPATLEDFVWWSGLNVSDCRKGISALADELHSVKWHNRESSSTKMPDIMEYVMQTSCFFLRMTNTSLGIRAATLRCPKPTVIMPTTRRASSTLSSFGTELPVGIGSLLKSRCSASRLTQPTT